MLCEICNKNEATIQFIKQNNSIGKDIIMICEVCAINIMKYSLYKNDIKSIDKEQDDKNLNLQNKFCENCGTGYIDLKENNILGCEECYQNFRDEINKYFGSESDYIYIGKKPKSLEKNFMEKELLDLEEQLKINILNEDYERAIIIKQKIIDIKKNIFEVDNNE